MNGLTTLHMEGDVCKLGDITRACARHGSTYHVQVSGHHHGPNTVLQNAFNLEGRLLEVEPNVKVVPVDNTETNKVNVHILADDSHLLLHAKHLGRRYGTRFEDQAIMDTLATNVSVPGLSERLKSRLSRN